MKTLLPLSLSFLCCWATLVVELPQSEKVYLKMDKEIQIRNIITFCIRFNLRGTIAKDRFLFSSFPTQLGVLLVVKRSIGFVRLNKNNLVFKIPKETIKPYSWYHFCFSANESTYQISVEGECIVIPECLPTSEYLVTI